MEITIKKTFSETSARCVEPSNVKHKRHPSTSGSETLETAENTTVRPPTATKNPLVGQEKTSLVEKYSVDSFIEAKEARTSKEEAMYSDGEDSSSAAVITPHHPKFIQVATAAGAGGPLVSLQTGLFLISYWAVGLRGH
jgi:hypothetical protein